jgi:hypothetical protein
MTSQEYTQWLKGFLDAVDNYSITKKQFDAIREKLKEVDDTTQSIGNPIGNGGWWGGTTPYSIPLSGTITTGGTITTSNYPSGSTLTYTTGNGALSTYTTANSGTAIVTNGTITSTNAYVNQSEDGDEKLLLD